MFGWDFGLVCALTSFKLQYAAKPVVFAHNANSTIRQSLLLLLTFPIARKLALFVP